MTKQREELYESYRRLGMTEEQIQAIKEFDDAVEKSDKDFYENTVPIGDLKRKKRVKEECDYE